MKNYLPLFFLLLTTGCVFFPYGGDDGEGEPEEDYCFTYNPFYGESHDVTYLEVECVCVDSIVDLATKLLPYTSVNRLEFECDEHHFNLIPPMPNVEYLYSQVVTDNLPDAFPSLKWLELTNTTNFYAGLKDVPLEHFSLEYSVGNEIPVEVTQLTNLTKIKVRGWIYEESALPDDIGNLINLESLDLEYVQDLPNSFSQLSNLKNLNIRGSGALRTKLYSERDKFQQMKVLNSRF